MHTPALKRSLLFTFLAAAPQLLAQTGPTWQVLTATDYSVVANDGTGEVLDGKPANTTLAFPFQLQASAGSKVWAKHKSEIVLSSPLGKGLRIREEGAAKSTTTTGIALAGTLDEVGPVHLEPHTLIVGITGTTKPSGVVTIVWNASATASNSFAKTSIDLNGDLTPEFEGDVGRGTVVKTFPVTATSAGYFFTVETSAGTDIEGIGHGAFQLDLTMYFREGTSGVTFTPYGPECAGKLVGSAGASNGRQEIRLNLTNAAKNAIGLTVVGNQAIDLSLGTCKLLVAPLLVLPFRTDAVGAASQEFSVRAGFPFAIKAQAVTLSVSGSALVVGSSNGLRIESN